MQEYSFKKKENALALGLEYFLYGYNVGGKQTHSSPGRAGAAGRVSTDSRRGAGEAGPREPAGQGWAQEPRATQAAGVCTRVHTAIHKGKLV